jgi:hypothetical protein
MPDRLETVPDEVIQPSDEPVREPDGRERLSHWSDSEWATRIVEQISRYAANH